MTNDEKDGFQQSLFELRVTQLDETGCWLSTVPMLTMIVDGDLARDLQEWLARRMVAKADEAKEAANGL